MQVFLIISCLIFQVLITFWIALSVCVVLDSLRKKKNLAVDDTATPELTYAQWPDWQKIKNEKKLIPFFLTVTLCAAVTILILPVLVWGKLREKDTSASSEASNPETNQA